MSTPEEKSNEETKEIEVKKVDPFSIDRFPRCSNMHVMIKDSHSARTSRPIEITCDSCRSIIHSKSTKIFSN